MFREPTSTREEGLQQEEEEGFSPSDIVLSNPQDDRKETIVDLSEFEQAAIPYHQSIKQQEYNENRHYPEGRHIVESEVELHQNNNMQNLPDQLLNWFLSKIHLGHQMRNLNHYLPPEVCLRIFYFLHPTMLLGPIRLVCRKWQEIVEEEVFFGPVVMLNYGDGSLMRQVMIDCEIQEEITNSNEDNQEENQEEKNEIVKKEPSNNLDDFLIMTNLSDEEKQQVKVKQNLLAYVIECILLKRYHHYLISYKTFINETFLTFREKEELAITKLPYPIVPPAKKWNPLGINADSKIEDVRRCMFYEFMTEDQREEFVKIDTCIKKPEETPPLEDSTTPQTDPRKHMSTVSLFSEHSLSFVLNKKLKGYNWFEMYDQIKNECIAFQNYRDKREQNMEKMYQITRVFYVPFSYALVVLSLILMILKFIAIDSSLHGKSVDARNLPEFDYFWIVCFAPILMALVVLNNTPLTIILQLVRDWKELIVQFKRREKYLQMIPHFDIFPIIKRHVYLGEVLRRIMVHLGISITFIAVFSSIVLNLITLVLPAYTTYFSFSNDIYTSSYRTRQFFNNGFLVMSPLMALAPATGMAYFLLSNRLYIHYIFVTKTNFIFGLLLIYTIYCGAYFGFIFAIAVDIATRFMCIGALMLIVVISALLFSLSFELKKNLQKSGPKDKWVVADGASLLVFLLMVVLFIITLTASKYMDIPAVYSVLLMVVPLLIGFCCLGINVVFSMINGRKSLIGRLLRNSFHYTSTSMSLAPREVTETVSLGR